jgi:4-hydroxy-4-methyl-2-oxoglutarate aldolase
VVCEGGGVNAAQLVMLGAATLGESGARPMHPRIKPVWAGATVAGPALTVRCGRGDNLAIHVALADAGENARDAVLVVDASAVPDLGYWGEVLTTAAEARGLAGLVIDGGVRDTDAIERHGFPVFSALVALPGATKVAGGSVGGRVTVGGVAVAPGDWVVGDRDGVVAIAEADLAAVTAAGQARADRESVLFQQLVSGATTVELLGLDPSRLDRA